MRTMELDFQEMFGTLKGLQGHAERQQQVTTTAYESMAAALTRLAAVLEKLVNVLDDKKNG